MFFWFLFPFQRNDENTVKNYHLRKRKMPAHGAFSRSASASSASAVTVVCSV